MNAPERIAALPDIQSSLDPRNLAIQRVGVRGVRMPMRIATERGEQPTVAEFEMTVHLPADQKGTHMSRFLEILEATSAPLDAAAMQTMLDAVCSRLEADGAFLRARMPLFIQKAAPVSGVVSTMDYELCLEVERRPGQATDRISQEVLVPVTSLCPCSKNISEYGAHNQRSHIRIAVDIDPNACAEGPRPETMIRAAEAAASCELWGLLKRPDEKYVTERAYDNPKFVEDLVRDVALAANQLPHVVGSQVESENFESIHNHSAVATLLSGTRLPRC